MMKYTQYMYEEVFAPGKRIRSWGKLHRQTGALAFL